MAGINLGHSGSGRKSVDAEIPLIPFIDLLLCCVMFLLVTAVWNQLAAISPADASTSSDPTAIPARDTDFLRVRVTQRGFAIEDPLGAVEAVPRRGGSLDLSTLIRAMERRGVDGRPLPVFLAPDDGTSHGEVIMTLDGLLGGGFPDVRIAGAGG